MNQLLNTIFSNNKPLSIMNTQTKAENPLFPIARTKHREAVNTNDFDFLTQTPANENTFILGFCTGVGHASEKFSKQIQEMQQTIKELKAMQTVI